MATVVITHGYRVKEEAEIVKTTSYICQNQSFPMSIVKFPDGETFGYPHSHIRAKKQKK